MWENNMHYISAKHYINIMRQQLIGQEISTAASNSIVTTITAPSTFQCLAIFNDHYKNINISHQAGPNTAHINCNQGSMGKRLKMTSHQTHQTPPMISGRNLCKK